MKKNEKNKEWMTAEILQLMEKRRSLKGKERYNEINKRIQIEHLKVKEDWHNNKCNQTQNMYYDIRTVPMRKRTYGN